jgi:hypothetical protein
MKHFLDINKTNVNDLNQILDQAKKQKLLALDLQMVHMILIKLYQVKWWH